MYYSTLLDPETSSNVEYIAQIENFGEGFMKVERVEDSFKVTCPNCQESFECLGGSADHSGCTIACGMWAAHHLCYKRRINIARETGAMKSES